LTTSEGEAVLTHELDRQVREFLRAVGEDAPETTDLMIVLNDPDENGECYVDVETKTSHYRFRFETFRAVMGDLHLEHTRPRAVHTELGVIQKPPGFSLERFLRFLVSKKSYERVYGQIIADMREEYFEALHAGEKRKARWIVVRAYVSVLTALLMLLPRGLVNEIVRLRGE
jgi:hypothetical protein